MDDSQYLNMTNLDESMSKASYQRMQTQKLTNKYKKMPTYMLNDFDDNYSVSDAADLSVISGSLKHFGGGYMGRSLVFEAESQRNLQPTAQIMKEMAPEKITSNQMAVHKQTSIVSRASRKSHLRTGSEGSQMSLPNNTKTNAPSILNSPNIN